MCVFIAKVGDIKHFFYFLYVNLCSANFPYLIVETCKQLTHTLILCVQNTQHVSLIQKVYAEGEVTPPVSPLVLMYAAFYNYSSTENMFIRLRPFFMPGMDINIHLSLSFRLQLQASTIKPPNRFTSNYIAQGTIRPSLVYIHIVNHVCISSRNMAHCPSSCPSPGSYPPNICKCIIYIQGRIQDLA